MSSSEKYLADFHRSLGDLRDDFRNKNLNFMVSSKVKGDSVLDIGCGSGLLLNLLSIGGKRTYGIEPNIGLIQLAKKNHPKLIIYEGLAEDIDETFDRMVDNILLIDVLEHIEDDQLLIEKIYHHLHKSGQLIIVVPVYQFLYGKRDQNSGHYRRYSKKNLVELLSERGFGIQQIRYWNMLGFFPYLFYEKVLQREINAEIRGIHKKGFLKNLLNGGLDTWFKHIENNINFGFGLSLICVAHKKR